MAASPPARDSDAEAVRAFARALGIAWVGASLYENPLDQEAFSAAAARVGELAGYLPPVEVSARTLLIGPRDLADEGMATERMAQALYLHGVGALRFTSELTAGALATFFEVAGLPPEVVAQEGGLGQAAARRNVVGVEPITTAGGTEDEGTIDTWANRWKWGADGLAAVLRSVDQVELPKILVAGFIDAAGVGDEHERQAAVAVRVEALMTLPTAVQATVVDRVCEQDSSLVNAIFRHLATHELERLAGALSPASKMRASAALYARGDLHSETLAAPTPDTTGMVEVPPIDAWWPELSLVMETVLRHGSEDEARDPVETWARSLDGLIRGGRFDVAGTWLGIPDRIDEPELGRRLSGRRRSLPTREALDVLVDADGVDAARLLTQLLRTSAPHLLALLGGFDDERLDVVVARLGALVGNDSDVLLDHLPESVLPLEIALRIVGASPTDVGEDPRVLRHLSHRDPRVVVAAVGAAGQGLDPAILAGLLRHRTADVREAAILGFRRQWGPAVGVLAGALLDVELDPWTVEHAARALVAMPGGDVALARTVSNSQLRSTSKGRVVRRQLRSVLKEVR